MNANQGVLSVIRFDTSVSAVNYGSRNLSAAMDGTTLKITESNGNTLWGLTFIIIYANFRMDDVA